VSLLGMFVAVVLAVWLFVVPSPSERRVGSYQECVVGVDDLMTYEFLSKGPWGSTGSDGEIRKAVQFACRTLPPSSEKTYGDVAFIARRKLSSDAYQELGDSIRLQQLIEKPGWSKRSVDELSDLVKP
jgi:hypothetical protein